MHFVKAKGILSAKNGMNLYRGCSHGCIYCDSRSNCYHMEHAFEDIEVKQNAMVLLEDALRRKRKKCMIGTGSMCDPYLPCEETLGLTRKCLEIIDDYGFGVTVLTKSTRILRDIGLLEHIHHRAKCVVQMTLTTCDEALCRIIEPNVSTTAERVEALKEFRERGIPTVVWMSPILPFLNDTEENIAGLVRLCAEAGVLGILFFGASITLRAGDREYFYSALDRSFPGVKQKYIERFGNAYECESPKNASLSALFRRECERYGIRHDLRELFSHLHEFPDLPPQFDRISLF